MSAHEHPSATAGFLRRIRLVLLAGVAAALASALIVAWLSRTGLVGFVTVLTGILVCGGFGVVLRDLRRQNRRLARLRDDVVRVRKQAEAAAKKQQAAARASEEFVRTHHRELVRALVSREVREPSASSQLRQYQAIDQLRTLVSQPARLPALAAPDVVMFVAGQLLARRPGLMVLCGGAAAAVWLSWVAARHEIETSIVCLEDDPVAADLAHRAAAEREGSGALEIRVATLADFENDGYSGQWYDRAVYDDLTGIDLLYVAGPREREGERYVRFPAAGEFASRLSADPLVVLDDLSARGDAELADRWQIRLPELTLSRSALEDAAVFSCVRAVPARG